MTSPQRIDYHGAPAIHLRSPDGAEAIVLEHGGHLVSWKPAGGEERIYVSPKAEFKEGTPVRGGVPVIFPQFGQRGPLQGHGFARRMNWQVIDVRTGKDYAIAHLRLDHSAATLKLWPYEFSLEVAVNISGSRLDVELEVTNTGTETFEFTGALHTYLAVNEVEESGIEGLQGHTCVDMLSNKEFRETQNPVTIEQEVDRVYYGVTKPLMLNEPRRGLLIQAENMPDTVVWNPWVERCAQLADMPKDGFRRMLCIEAAVIRDPVRLAPGGDWRGRQTLIAMDS